jgi:quercetin dioxygenase-like cupin family protein
MKSKQKRLVLILSIPIFLALIGCATVQSGSGKPIVSSPEELSLPIGQATDNPALFNGTVYLSRLVSHETVYNSPEMSYVVFPPGIINKWHSHGGGQILIATDGIGYHQLEGQPLEIMYPGDVAHCPPDVIHWHGASPDSWFAHIVVMTNPEKQSLEIFDFIPEAEYKSLPRTKQ